MAELTTKEKKMKEIKIDERLLSYINQSKLDEIDKNIVVLGPDGTNDNKLRIYAYGGCLGYIPITMRSSQTFSTLNEDYYKQRTEKGEKVLLDTISKEDDKLICSLESLRLEPFLERCKQGDLKKYLKIASSLVRVKGKSEEREVETEMLHDMMTNKVEDGMVIVDMEFMMKINRKTHIFKNGKRKIKKGSKPDLVVFDGKSFGIVELKYNGASMEFRAENDVAEHFLDFEYFLKKNNSEIRWKAIEQLLRRMKYLMEIGSINKEAWSDSWENIYNIYINNKDKEFASKLIWTGFLFVDGDENMIRKEITKQINDIPYREGVKDEFDLERLNGVKYMYCKRGKWDLRQMIELKSTL